MKRRRRRKRSSKRKKPRDMIALAAIQHTGAGKHPDQRKERNKNKCREKVDVEKVIREEEK